MATRLLSNLTLACKAIGAAIADNAEELWCAVALVLIAIGLRQVWAPGAFIVPGIVLLWIWLPARTSFVVSKKSDDRKGRT